jgi:hypothetical protein
MNGSSRAQGRVGRTLKKIVFLLLIDGLVLGGAELVARLASPPYHVEVVRKERLQRPKSAGEKRIFVYGESTVFGLPYEARNSTTCWLEAILAGVLPGEPVRVINFGRPGRGSYHILDALEQTLPYQPDLVVLCVGHNEFLPWSHRLVQRPVQRWCYFHSHVYRNLFEAVSRYQSRRDPGRAYCGIPVGTPLRDQILTTYRKSMAEMVAAAQRRGVPVVLCVPACNLAAQPPMQAQNPPSLDPNEVQQIESLIQDLSRARQNQQSSAELLSRAAAYEGTNATVHFLRGNLLDLAGQHVEAYQAYAKARDDDSMPFRCQAQQIVDLRDLSRRTGTEFVDLPEIFRAASDGRAPGANLFVDACHPRPLGQYLMAKAIAQAVITSRLLGAAGGCWENLPSFEQCARQFYSEEEWRQQERAILCRQLERNSDRAVDETRFPPPLAPTTDLEWSALRVLACWRCGRQIEARQNWSRFRPTELKALEIIAEHWPAQVQHFWSEMLGFLQSDAADRN